MPTARRAHRKSHSSTKHLATVLRRCAQDPFSVHTAAATPASGFRAPGTGFGSLPLPRRSSRACCCRLPATASTAVNQACTAAQCAVAALPFSCSAPECDSRALPVSRDASSALARRLALSRTCSTSAARWTGSRHGLGPAAAHQTGRFRLDRALAQPTGARAAVLLVCGLKHAHMAAMRYAVKRLLQDLWVEWHRRHKPAVVVGGDFDASTAAPFN
jgi:hypothetical protein